MTAGRPDRPGGRTGHVVLVGMMATGKTTVGKLLASALGRPFLDSDQLVEARTGHTVKELFEASGEAGFRREEADALASCLADPTPAVIAAAGGVVLDPTNRRLIRGAVAAGGLVVWLRADVAVLAARAASGTHRPLLADDPLGALTRLSAVREPLYREVADLEIDVAADGGLSPTEVTDRILAAVAATPDASSAGRST